MNIAFVGAGSLGSEAVRMYVRACSGIELKTNVTIIDDDSVSDRNLFSQAFYPSDVGKTKAEVLADRLGDYFHVGFNPIVDRFSLDNSEMLEGMHLIVDCTDNLDARKELWQYSCFYGTPLLSACSSPNGYGYVNVTLKRGELDVDTNPFGKSYTAGAEQDEIPPCELAGLAPLGNQIAMALNKAIFLLGFGLDYTNYLPTVADKFPDLREGIIASSWECTGTYHKMTGAKLIA